MAFVGGGDIERVLLGNDLAALSAPLAVAFRSMVRGGGDEDVVSDDLVGTSFSSSKSDTAGVRSMVESFSPRRLTSPTSRADGVAVTAAAACFVGGGFAFCSCEKRQLVSLHLSAPVGHDICLKTCEENIVEACPGTGGVLMNE